MVKAVLPLAALVCVLLVPALDAHPSFYYSRTAFAAFRCSKTPSEAGAAGDITYPKGGHGSFQQNSNNLSFELRNADNTVVTSYVPGAAHTFKLIATSNAECYIRVSQGAFAVSEYTGEQYCDRKVWWTNSGATAFSLSWTAPAAGTGDVVFAATTATGFSSPHYGNSVTISEGTAPTANPSPPPPANQTPTPTADPSPPPPTIKPSPPPPVTVNPSPPPPAAASPTVSCPPSTLDGFDCMIEQANGDYSMHYSLNYASDGTRRALRQEDPISANIAVQSKGQGWVGVAFPDNPGSMVRADAVIGWVTDSGVASINVYELNGYSSSSVQVSSAFAITDTSVTQTAAGTTMQFTRAFDNTFTADGDTTLLYAYAQTSDSISYHGGGLGKRGGFAVSLVSGSTTEVKIETKTKYHKAHGILMALAWGFFLPMGALVSASKFSTPKWLYTHIAFQSLGVIFAIIAWVIAIAKFNEYDGNHKKLGITVMSLLFLNFVGGMIRPKPKGEDGAKSTLRWAWELFHKGGGLIYITLAAVNVHLGLARYHKVNGGRSVTGLQAGYWAWLGVLLVVYVALNIRTYRNNKNQAEPEAAQLDMQNMHSKGYGQGPASVEG